MTLFRWVAYLEGISFLVLLAVAMPLKYMYGMPMAVKIMGMAHGIFFLAYVGMVAWLASEHSWPMRKSLWGLAAGVLPFGSFVFEGGLRRENRG